MRIGSLAVRAAAFFVGVAEAVSGSVGSKLGLRGSGLGGKGSLGAALWEGRLRGGIVGDARALFRQAQFMAFCIVSPFAEHSGG